MFSDKISLSYQQCFNSHPNSLYITIYKLSICLQNILGQFLYIGLSGLSFLGTHGTFLQLVAPLFALVTKAIREGTFIAEMVLGSTAKTILCFFLLSSTALLSQQLLHLICDNLSNHHSQLSA